jgi:hypothetical protein
VTRINLQRAIEKLPEVTRNVWEMLVGLELAPSAPDGVTPGEGWMFGRVRVTGDWAGRITVGCSERLAQEIAATLFCVEVGDLSEEETVDALGELSHITSGNILPLVPVSARAALPEVGAWRGGHSDGYRVVGRAAFFCKGEPFLVSLEEIEDSDPVSPPYSPF